MQNTEEHYDIVVCGGGLAGLSAAVSSARQGAKTCLIQDRPVLGGNASSEIRVTPHGAALCHAYARETGIVSELLIEERSCNHQESMENGGMNSTWDLVMYDLAMRTPNLTLHLNTSIREVIMAATPSTKKHPVNTEAHCKLGFYHRPACNVSRELESVRCQVNNAEVMMTIHGKVFIDATGDGIVADLAGCEWRMGSESSTEFNEPHGLKQASTGVMGSSIHFRTREMDRPCPYHLPDWAVQFSEPDYFKCYHRSIHDTRGGYWWFEISVPWHTIHDNENIRHELTRHVLGVWDWMKNHDPEMKEKLTNHALDWIGQVPGKRESRRIMGRYLLTENDVLEKRVFPDEVAFGGWYVDLHEPGGMLLDGSENSEPENKNPSTYCGPYGLPLRMLISKDVDNLMLAGRNVSATHAALGSVRVMGTTAIVGEAAGVAAAVALANGHTLEEAVRDDITAVQQALLRNGCFLPNHQNNDSEDLTKHAHIQASSEAGIESAEPSNYKSTAEQAHLAQRDCLSHLRCQWIATSSNTIDLLSAYVINTSNQEQPLKVRLIAAENIWDYRLEIDSTDLLAEAELRVPANHEGWIDWPCSCPAQPGSYVRFDLLPNDALIWKTATEHVPGFPGAFEFVPSQMRRWHDSCTSSFRINPVQFAWPAVLVASGVTRPCQKTNVWRSDPNKPLPQWLALHWPQMISCSRVELTFPGNILSEYHKYPPFWKDPQTPSDYRIESRINGDWITILDIHGNYQRQRTHTFAEPIKTQDIRVVVTKTNGDPAAAITEVRCYA